MYPTFTKKTLGNKQKNQTNTIKSSIFSKVRIRVYKSSKEENTVNPIYK